MKHLITVFAALCALLAAPAAFAGEPIPGLSVGLEKEPGGIAPPQMMMTARNGQAGFRVEEAGAYSLFLAGGERARGFAELIESGALQVRVQINDTVIDAPVTSCAWDGERLSLIGLTASPGDRIAVTVEREELHE